MYIPDNNDAADQYDAELERSKRLHKRLGELERMEDIDNDFICIDGTV